MNALRLCQTTSCYKTESYITLLGLNVFFLYLGLFIYDDAGSFWDGEGEKWSLGGSQDEVSVSLDHRVQVLPLWLGAVVHCYLV